MADTAHPPQHDHQPPPPPAHKPEPKHASKMERASMISNLLAIAGSIILLAIVIWGLIHLFSISGGFFSSLFGRSSSAIVITAPSEVISGESVNISWKHSTKESGMYAIMYPCTEGLRFSTPAPDSTFITMPCGAAFAVGSLSGQGATTSAMVVPMLTATSSVKTPITVLFIPSSTSSAPVDASVNMTVRPRTGTQPLAPVATTTPRTPDPTPTTPRLPAGPADLAVTITSVSVDQYGNGVVTFNISNIGSGNSGSYSFTAQLPTSQPYTYVSPTQTSLSPGSYIVNTLRFTQAVSGTISIIVDPSNSVIEVNEGNNAAIRSIGASYPYNYNYQYQPTQPTYYDIYNYPYVY